MPIPKDELGKLLQDAFPAANITIEDLAGDDDHYHATIISKRFAGLSRVKQHQLVYQALDGKMGGELHALQLTTRPKN